jgi:ADP-heptose:LPS heptosyltransferase
LRALYPQWQLHLFTSPVAVELFAAHLRPEEMLVMPTRAFNDAWKRPPMLLRLLAQAWRERFDASLLADDQGNVAHFLARWTGGRTRVGIRPEFIKVRGSLTDVVTPLAGLKIAQLNWEIARVLVERLGGREWPATPPPPDLRHLTGDAQPIAGRIVIHSGASLAYKRWFAERFQALASRLAERFEVIWIEQPETKGLELPPAVRRVSPGSLGEFVRLLRSASLLIGNNSGPMNLAAALGCPSVILSGPSNLVWDPLWHPERCLILRDTSLPCLPCDGPVRPAQVCRNTASPMACMAHWSVEEVHRLSCAWIETRSWTPVA